MGLETNQPTLQRVLETANLLLKCGAKEGRQISEWYLAEMSKEMNKTAGPTRYDAIEAEALDKIIKLINS